ncbi:uncharacterized protein LOC141685698 [Apium graveolens]|uniref:uncharacterized protein LOC141685698 n=1 Tax=Apium graveolens TaxID=4045 RepID=UPI003D7AF7AA
MNLHLGGRLWKQFMVDAFAAVEQYRLDWIRAHQNIIRSNLYKSIRDSVSKSDTNSSTKGKNVILPATHTGSQRYMNQYFKDSLAIYRTIGHPSLFLTMTCNTQWPEIKSMMNFFPGVDVADKPDVTARVFKLKLDQLLDLIKNKNYFGKYIRVMHVIEFQKHGLPHCHMLIWLHPRDRPQNVDDINQLISAEIPDKNHDPIGFNVVNSHMIHRPCGKDYSYSPCMVKGNCGRHFPKRRRTGLIVTKKGVELDNQYVVPYNRDLLVRFHCHINLEVCNSSRSLKYLFKYCLKGHDTATMILRKKQQGNEASTSSSKPKSNDEIKNFLDGRYICVSEASWRLLGFDIHNRFSTVEHLSVHLEGEKSVSFKQHENLQDVAEKAKKRFSKLEGWFQENKNIPEARQFIYHQFPQNFTWKQDQNRWKIRERGTVFGRLYDAHASSGETFYLCIILMHIKGATSFKDLRTVNGIVYNTYKEACDALGLLKDDKQWDVAISRSLKYLFKYCLKGHDTATMILRKKQQGNEASTSSSKPKSNDEIKNFLDGRYICVSEASWRLLGFDIHNRFSTVERLSVHLEGENSVSFKQHENLQDVAEKAKKRFSKLEGWFQANKNIPEARQFTYHQFPQNFT